MTKPVRKKLIEVALPLEAINEEGSRRKRKAPAGYPTALHKWWAQRPVAAARGVLFAQLVDDPSSWPDLFPTEKKQEKERQRLFKIIEELVLWDNTTNEDVLQRARDEIWRSWRRTCAENADHPQAKELFDREKMPELHDPFAGGGTLPLEAQRLGLSVRASDLNPVAVLINKALIEIPPLFSDQPPINPDSEPSNAMRTWTGADGLAEDVRFYAEKVRDACWGTLHDIFPEAQVTPEMTSERPRLSAVRGKRLPVVAWMWVRTVKSPNPAFRTVDVPLASTFMLSSKAGKEAYVKPILHDSGYSFAICDGKPADPSIKSGTKLGRGANFRCLMSGAVIDESYVKAESMAGRMGLRLMAMVADSSIGRIYLPPTDSQESFVDVRPAWKPDLEMNRNCKDLVSGRGYGVFTWGDLFTNRQSHSLHTFLRSIESLQSTIIADARRAQVQDPESYASAVHVFLVIVFSRMLHHSSMVCTWLPKDSAIRQTFSKQAIPITWDFVEGNPFAKSSAAWDQCAKVVTAAIECLPSMPRGSAFQADAAHALDSYGPALISTDPPYYDNVSYADLSDYFYVWLREGLRSVYPGLFATIAVPKDAELVASSHRHGGSQAAEAFFLEGMTSVFTNLAKNAHPAFPVTIYYAFKQAEAADDGGTSSTGWETFLEAVLRSGFRITGTWPMRTEGDNRQVSVGTNALASSIVLVCRRRDEDEPTATRRELLTALQKELPIAISDLQRGNVAPVDLQQAAIGPGMAVFTRYAKVLDADGKPLSVRDALTMINQALDEVLAEQEGDFDSDTRWALSWFEQFGFSEGDYGDAEILSKAKNTSVNGIVEAGIAVSGKGKVRLLKPEELPESWTPEGDKRLTVWDMVHHLIRVLAQGERQAAQLMAKLGSKAESARELAYRLYAICDRTKRSQDAQRYNGLVQSWPEIAQMAQQVPKQATERQQSFEGMD
jgi:putative DNA methylase